MWPDRVSNPGPLALESGVQEVIDRTRKSLSADKTKHRINPQGKITNKLRNPELLFLNKV